MIDHPPHVENARRALAHFDAAPTGAEIGTRGVRVASALRVLLYEPADEYQGYFMDDADAIDRQAAIDEMVADAIADFGS